MDSTNLTAFLNKLSELSCEYGIVIKGCGCCGSPYLLDRGEMLDGHYRIDKDGKEVINLQFVEDGQ